MSDTIEGLKALAKSLRETARAQGETVSHSQALEGVAKAHGFKDWNAAAAILPHAPAGLTIDDAVREFRALRVVADQSEPGWHRTTEYSDWCNRADDLLDRIIASFEPYPAASLLRYAVYVLRLPMNIRMMPGYQRFADKHRHIIMGNTEQWMAHFEKMFPNAKPEGNPYVVREPFTYGPLVREIQSIMKANTSLSEDEVIGILQKSGRPLNEATARGLYRKGYQPR